MAIHGKQLKDASIDLTKLEGITAPTAGQLLVAASNDSMQALNVGGDLTASPSGTTLGFVIAAGAVELSMIDGTAIISEAEKIENNDNDTTIPTSAAVKDYVDAQVSASVSGSSLELTAGTGSASIALATETLSVAGDANISTAASSTLNSLTVSLNDHISLTSATLSGALSVGGSAVIAGDLTVNGTTTTVSSTTVTVEDHNLELGSVANPSNTTANGGGITLKGGTDGDKRFYWSTTTNAWNSSEDISAAAGKQYKIGTTSVLTAAGAAKVQSTVAGDGLAHDSVNGRLSVDLSGIASADINVAADSITFVDADDSSTKTESVVDLVAAMAGDGISATSGVLATTRDIELITGISGTQPTIKTLSTDNIATNLIDLIELRVNGISYPQGGSSTDKEWYIDTNTRDLKWNDSSFSLETTDEIELVTYS